MKNLVLRLVLSGMLLAYGDNAFSQTITSAQPGPWNNTLTWIGGTIPNASNSTSIVINHNITIPSGFSAIIDQTNVGMGSSLTVNSGGNLNISAGTNTVVINGTLIAGPGSTITGTDGTNLSFSSSGTYRHLFTTTEGTIPLASWDVLSVIEIAGYTSTFSTATVSGNWEQTFGNFTWNCASQNGSISLEGLLKNVAGNLTVSSTGTTGALRFSTTGVSKIDVKKNFNVSGGTRLGFCTSGSGEVAVGGNYTQNLTSGYVRFADGGNNGIGTLEITGNFDLQAGILTETGGGTAQGNIDFVGTAGTIHTFSEVGSPTATLSGRLSFSVAASNRLNVLGESQLAGGGTSFLTLASNAILNLPSTDANGAFQTGTGQSAAGGNVRVGTKTYAAGAQLIYGGSSAQYIGNGQPTGSSVTTIVNNSAGVTQVAASTLVLAGNLTLQAGNLTVSNASLAVNGSTNIQAGTLSFTSLTVARSLTFGGNLTLTGNIAVTSGTANAAVTFSGNVTGIGTIAFSGLNSNLVINGSGNLTFPFAPGGVSLESLTCNRSAGTLIFPETLNVDTGISSSLLSVTAGSVDMRGDFNGRAITLTNATLISTSPNAPALPTTVRLFGNFTNNGGTFVPGRGTVIFTNAVNSTKLIQGTSLTAFNNLTVENNTSGTDVSVTGRVSVAGILTLNTNAIMDADGTGTGVLTILSSNDNPTQDGSIGILTGTSNITGNLTVQRYMSIEGANGGRIYRYISAPVQNAPVSDMQAEIPVTGSFTGTSLCTGCGTTQSLFRYDENVITDTNGDLVNDINDGYVDFPNAANSEVFAVARGYTLFVRGNLLVGSALWNLRGTINRGNAVAVPFPATFTSTGVTANDGWNLVGNPYISTIDWNAGAGWTKTNVGGTIHVRDNATGQFATWNGSVGVNGGSRYIPIGQAFWIQATAAPTLSATENVKVAGQQTMFLREAALTDVLRIAMVKGTLRDETVIHFRNDAATGYDAETDSRKFANATFNLSSILSTGEVLAINSSPFTCTQPVKLNIANAAIGSYALEFSEMETFNAEVDITLVDNFLNKTIDVAAANQYTFDVTSSPASFGSNRFSISFSEKAISDELQFSSQQVCEGDNASVTIQNSRSDVNYFLLKDGMSVSDSVQGNGGDLVLVVNKENLANGINNVMIQASTHRCLTTKLYPGSIVMSEKPSIETTAGKTCNEGTITLTAFTSGENVSFNWYDDSTSETILSSSKNFTTPIIFKSRTYYVSATNASGCTSERQPVLATVVQFEDVAITESGDGALHSSYLEGNKWFFNGIELPGEVSNILFPEKSGTYTVEVTTDGCSSFSEYEFVILATEHQNLASGVSVYPNPVVDKAFIDGTENKIVISNFTLHNNLGTVVAQGVWINEGANGIGSVDMSSLPTGVYILRLFTSDRIVSLKVHKR